MPCEGEGDRPSESGQTDAFKAILYLSHTPYTKGSMRRVGGKHTRREMVNSGYKEKKAGRPPPRRGQQGKDNQQRRWSERLQLYQPTTKHARRKRGACDYPANPITRALANKL
jgi:hypothetical protein